MPQSPSSGTHTLEQRRTLQIAPHLAAFPNETWLDYAAFSAKLTETSSSWLLTDRSLSDGRWLCSRLAVLAAGTQRMSCCTRQAKSTHAHLEPFDSYEAGGEGVGTLAEGAWLVKFYTEKCGHCRRLQPSWEALGGRDGRGAGLQPRLAGLQGVRRAPRRLREDAPGLAGARLASGGGDDERQSAGRHEALL